MTLNTAIREVYPTREEQADRYTVAHPDNYPDDLINRIQRGAYIATAL